MAVAARQLAINAIDVQNAVSAVKSNKLYNVELYISCLIIKKQPLDVYSKDCFFIYNREKIEALLFRKLSLSSSNPCKCRKFICIIID